MSFKVVLGLENNCYNFHGAKKNFLRSQKMAKLLKCITFLEFDLYYELNMIK